MALVTCKECGREVSSTAPTCPHCGAPFPGTVMGRLEIRRREQIIGSMQTLEFFLNDKKVASINPGQTATIDLPEGRYSYRATAWGGLKSDVYELTVSAGHTTKVESWAEPGIISGKLYFRVV